MHKHQLKTLLKATFVKGVRKTLGEHNTREKLKHYKIYFETVVMASMTLMSIIVSIVGVRIDQRNQEISQKELEILTSERPPYFQFQIEDQPTLTSDRFCTYEIHKLVNKGGTISGASLHADLVIMATIYAENEYVVCGFIPSMIRIPNEGLYDVETQSFTFFETRAGLGVDEEYYGIDEQFLTDLDRELINTLGVHYALFSKAYRFKINYIDYRNERNCVSYLFKDNGLFVEENAEIDADFSTFQIKNGRITYPGGSLVECYYKIQSISSETIKEEIKEIILDIIFNSSHQEENGDPQDKETDNG